MNKRILLVSMLLAIFSFNCIGQQQIPIKNVPSPEIAGLGEYGKVPVSLYTGVPDISVPVYELKAGSYSLSLSASYHLASVKPNSQSGCLGLGWNLMAGGYITRSVRGMYDEKCESNGYAPGYYAHASKLKNISNEQFRAETMHIQSTENDYYELTADEFSFNFCGYSGNFYYGGDGEWHVVSDQDIRMEFNPVNGDGFVSLAEVGKRIDTRGWGARTRNNRFFNKFTLITPDGCRYEFGGVDATEYSIPYYARYNSDLIATTWRLSKITTVDKRVIELSYDTSSIMCDLRYIPQQKVVTNIPCSYSGIQKGRSGMTGYLLFPVNIKSIKTPNEILEFNYYNEYGYGDRFVDSYIAWKSGGEKYDRQGVDDMNYEDPANQFTLFLGNNINNTDQATLRQSIKAKLQHKILHSIYVKGKNSNALKTIYFDYARNFRTKLALITERPGNPELIPNYVWHPHGYYFLTWYKVPENLTGGRVPEYRFLYNSEKQIPNDYVRPLADSWGYYTGGNVVFSDNPNFSQKPSNLQYTLADVLTDVIYPTGGKSRFEYQLNNYSKVVAPSLVSLIDRSGTAGGLRVQRITNLDSENNILGIKQYYYSNTRDRYGKSSGILKSLPVNEMVYTLKNGDNDPDPNNAISLFLKSEGGFFASVTNLNTPDVGYSCVIEEMLDKDNKSQGYIIRHYSNYDADIYGNTHHDELAFYSMLERESYTVPFSSRSMERGKLLSEEYFDTNDRLRKKVNYRYKEVNPGSFVTADQMVLFFCTDLDKFMLGKVGTLTRTYTHAYLTDSVIETLYPQPGTEAFVVKKAYQYNKYKQLSQIASDNSDGKNTMTEYVYAATLPEYKWMAEAHILSPMSSKKEQTGDSFLKETYQYGSSPIPYIKEISMNRNGYIKGHYNAEATDNYGNPIFIREKSMPVVLIWGGEGQRLVARIENATLSQVEEALGMKVKDFSSLSISSINFRKIENIRHKISGTHFYIYKYMTDLRLLSETKPNGMTVFYKYDFLGRLTESYVMELKGEEFQKRILNIYDYHYYYGSKVEDGGEIIEKGEQL